MDKKEKGEMLKLCALFSTRCRPRLCVCFVFQTFECRTAERAAASGGGIVSHFFRVRIKKEDKWNVILIFFFLSFVQSDKD
jgi:hypothetical protein